eukprot:6195478-Pleurochrysis_carterae.AAC.1
MALGQQLPLKGVFLLPPPPVSHWEMLLRRAAFNATPGQNHPSSMFHSWGVRAHKKHALRVSR